MKSILIDKLSLEQYKNSLTVIDENNPFLNITKPSVNELKELLNHNVWLRIKEDSNITEYICKIVDININNISLKELEYGKIIDVKLENIIGLLDITISINDKIDYKKYNHKIVKLTNYKGDSIECIIQYYDEYLIYFAVRLDNYDTLSYDLSYPINMIKNIELIEG